MSGELNVDFVRQFPGGPAIECRGTLLRDGEANITVLFGPSGSGKTTVLRCLAGLDRPQMGYIGLGTCTWFDRERGVFLPPQQRGMGFLFQDYALFPHLTVEANVGYGLKGSLSRESRRKRIGEMLDLLGLNGLEARYPRRISGGQQQRVALARALAPQPRMLLLDEPLSALDVPTREQLRREIRHLLRQLAMPTLVVTHDRAEALALGDHLIVYDNGRLCQSGPVHEVFSRPTSVAVARIVGVETVEPARVLSTADGLATIQVGTAQIIALDKKMAEGEIYVCIRAEDVILERGSAPTSSARNRLPATIRWINHEGPLVRVGLDCGFSLTALVTRQACDELALPEGQTVVALIKAPSIHLVARG